MSAKFASPRTKIGVSPKPRPPSFRTSNSSATALACTGRNWTKTSQSKALSKDDSASPLKRHKTPRAAPLNALSLRQKFHAAIPYAGNIRLFRPAHLGTALKLVGQVPPHVGGGNALPSW